jgi:small subunit ribosomal protein S14
MAKKSIQQREKRKIIQSERARKSRLALKLKVKKGTIEEQEEAMLTLQKKPRNQSQCRVRNRCRSCGRPRGTLRRFGLCRICLRKAAMNGHVPGLKKASW